MAIAADAGTGTGGSRPVLSAAAAAVEALGAAETGRVWALTEDEVRASMTALGEVAARTEAAMVTVLAEARRRGISTGAGWSSVDWVKAHAPALSTRAAIELDTVAAAADDLRLAHVVDAVTAVDQDHDVPAAPGVHPQRGRLLAGKAAQIIRFHRTVRPIADADQLAGCTTELVAGARGPHGLSERDLAVCIRRTGDYLRQDHWVEHDAAARRDARSLTKAHGPAGLWRYTLLLDEEGAQIIDTAVDALAKPHPDHDTGQHDPRRPQTRRADALLDLITRAVSAPDGTPRQAKTTLLVTMGLDALAGLRRGHGLTPTGEALTPETVRRLSCDAEIIPVVLGTSSEVLDQGRAKRLFTPAQIRHLWLRDRHCTFPGCSKPAAWTDAHHLTHWADGGTTDTGNAALLCRAHHTLVHTNRLAGHVTQTAHGPQVAWNLTPDSYTQRLTQLRTDGTLPHPPRRP